MRFEEILDEIEKRTGLSREELLEKIEEKQKNLENLVSKEGAVHLVAKDLGINLTSEIKRRLEMKNIVAGMKSVNTIGRVFKISDIVEFQRQDGSKGKVINLFIGDATGYVKLPLWNDQVSLIEEKVIKLGDAIQIVNGLAKENIFGDIEISLGRFGSIREAKAIELPSLDELTKKFLHFEPERVLIKDISPGNFEVRASIVHVFKGNFLFNICPICGDKLEENKCLEHGEVQPKQAIVISCIVDDGTGDLRVVFFRELAEKLIEKNAEEIVKLDLEKRYEEIKEKLLGRELILTGKVRKNKIFNRLELIVNNFKDLNILEESRKLAEKLEFEIGG